MPKYGNPAPGPKNEFFKIVEKVYRFRFQMEFFKKTFLAYYEKEILSKMEFFRKGLSLPTSPQPPPDIKFKLSYARKRAFGLLCPNMEIRPQAPKMEFFKKFSFF